MSKHRRATALLFVLVLLSASLLFGQTTPAQPDEPEAPAVPAEPRPAGDPSDRPSQGQPSPALTASTITPEQLAELRASLDAILKFASEQTGFPIRSKVKLELRSRADVNQFLQERMRENKETARLEQSELVMKKLGLLPPEFRLRQFIVDAYSEQVAGYYDAKSKTMCLLDWVPFDEQRPVMAHELTHALQDQRMRLDKWLLADSAADKTTPASQRDAALDELRLARSSVAEGQAMVVLWNYNLVSIGLTVENAEDVIAESTAGMLDAKGSPTMSSAPLYIRRGLIFPYREGFEFVRQVLIHRGRAKAFAGTLQDPPVSSRQIMEPRAYLRNESIPQLKVPDFRRVLGKEWVPADFGAMGQIDLAVMLQLYESEKLANELSSKWRGGYYYAARPKGKKDSQLALLYVSRWADNGSAQRFADIYAASWKKRYKNPQTEMRSADTTTATTEEGSVSVARRGDIVVAVESFPDGDALKLRQASFAANQPEAENVAVVPMRLHPLLDLSALLRVSLVPVVTKSGQQKPR